jgi:hypothetical protein
MEGRRYFLQISKLTLLDRFSKNTQISNSMNICAMEAELFFENGRTDRHDKANSRFFAILRKRLKADILIRHVRVSITCYFFKLQLSSRTHNANIFHYFCHVCNREAVTFIARNCQTAVTNFSMSVRHSVRI